MNVIIILETRSDSDTTEFFHTGDISREEEEWCTKAIEECVYVSEGEFDSW